MTTYTLTFCECAESHVDTQKIGNIAQNGYTIEELKTVFENKNLSCNYLDLGGPEKNGASVLIIKNGVNCLLKDPEGANKIMDEHTNIKPYWDTKCLMGRGIRRKVMNKHARYNLCFSNFSQNPVYEEGKGTIIDYNHPCVENTNKLRKSIPEILGSTFELPNIESNYYYDINKSTYIGFHGDTERKKVIGVRFGSTMPIWWQWFHDSKLVGDMIKVDLEHGDMYIMSDKAVGQDWKLRSKITLRHAAGKEDVLRRNAKSVMDRATNIISYK